jgi:hypothetical protein
MRKDKQKFRAGDLVEILPYEEIKKTLDERGSLNGLPFMPEMQPFCGRCFRVFKVVHHVCIEGEYEARQIKEALFLEDLRCDGAYHGGCMRQCGHEFVVKARLDKMILENTGKMLDLKNTVLLENAICDGKCNFPCTRHMYHFCQRPELNTHLEF